MSAWRTLGHDQLANFLIGYEELLPQFIRRLRRREMVRHTNDLLSQIRPTIIELILFQYEAN